MAIIYVYITNPTKAEAKKIAMYLLRKRLIACANIFPIASMYWWKGRIANEKEYVLIAKTAARNYNNVRKEVEKMHSYTVPCIVRIPVSVNKKYASWLMGEIKK